MQFQSIFGQHIQHVTMASPNDDENAVDLTAETDKAKKQEENGDKASGKKKSGKKSKKDKKKGKGTKDDAIVEENTLSEEDQELKDRLETCVTTVTNAANEAAVTVPLRLKALDVIVSELRSATSSMTSVPKPLKFLRPHFDTLKKLHAGFTDEVVKADAEMLTLRARLADVLSVLAMTMGKHGKWLASLVFGSFWQLCVGRPTPRHICARAHACIRYPR